MFLNKKNMHKVLHFVKLSKVRMVSSQNKIDWKETSNHERFFQKTSKN